MDKHNVSNNYSRAIRKDGDWGNKIFDYESKMHKKPQADQEHKNIVVLNSYWLLNPKEFLAQQVLGEGNKLRTGY